MNILIIGGTRHMGHFLALALLDAGHNVTVLNRGITPNDLPDAVAHLKADRTIPAQLEQAIAGHSFDAVVDFVLYEAADAEVAVDLFLGKVEHYIFISTGQVYLLRADATPPYTEDDYDGVTIPEPPLNTYDHEEWLYGLRKRRVEDTLARAYAEHNFPYTSLRLPMVNGERDPMNRLYSYILRIKDGGPILIPDDPDPSLRHVYARDVVRAVMRVLQTSTSAGDVYNISQDESVTLPDFLNMVGDLLGTAPDIVRVERSLLEANGFLPDCSPFSEKWMSELDNTHSKDVLGMTYTPMHEYLAHIVAHYEANPPRHPLSYRRRQAEKQFARSYAH